MSPLPLVAPYPTAPRVCVTRMASISLRFRTDIIPLPGTYTLLDTASPSNNLAAFPGGEAEDGWDGGNSWMLLYTVLV